MQPASYVAFPILALAVALVALRLTLQARLWGRRQWRRYGRGLLS